MPTRKAAASTDHDPLVKGLSTSISVKKINRDIDNLRGDIDKGVRDGILTLEDRTRLNSKIDDLKNEVDPLGPIIADAQSEGYKARIAAEDDYIKLAKFANREVAHDTRRKTGEVIETLSKEDVKNILAKQGAVHDLKSAVSSDGVVTDTEEAAITAGLNAVDDTFKKAEYDGDSNKNVGSAVLLNPGKLNEKYTGKQAEQLGQLDAGFLDGTLTRTEIGGVWAKFTAVEKFREAAMSDGKITEVENTAINSMLKVTSQAIYEARNGVVIK